MSQQKEELSPGFITFLAAVFIGGTVAMLWGKRTEAQVQPRTEWPRPVLVIDMIVHNSTEALRYSRKRRNSR
jgi:hypothetical protein